MNNTEFTNADLRFEIDWLNGLVGEVIRLPEWRLRALINRMEAGEKVIDCLQGMINWHECGHSLAWRKACGNE